MKKIVIFLVFILSFVLLGCSKNPIDDQVDDIVDVPIIYNYLNEVFPINESKRFEPSGYLANENWHWHGTPVFSPDGKEMYWSKYIKASNDIEIWFTKENNDIWGEPEKLIIDGINGAYNCPVFVDGGRQLYFLNFDGIAFTIYKLTRDGDAWINPVAIQLNIPNGKMLGWSFSVSENKNIYFLLWDLNGLEHQKIYRSIYHNGEYGESQPLDILDIGSDGVGGPSIASDESYIIFDSVRPNGYGMHDIYISFKNDSDEFMAPINLGDQVNTTGEDAGVAISPDGLYMFYTTLKVNDLGYNPYWIKIDELNAFITE
ncbi:MAG: hypothetical protein KKH01_05625 [Firmicutes bacterium]|nr:hypothetical protein [Bacillota bacterium]